LITIAITVENSTENLLGQRWSCSLESSLTSHPVRRKPDELGMQFDNTIVQGAFTITDCNHIKKRLRSRDCTKKQFVTQRKLSKRNREVQMKSRRNSSGLITASLIVYQILCNFKANTSSELAVTLAWHSGADAFVLYTLLLHPSASMTPAAAHLQPIFPRGSIYCSYRAIRRGYRSLATDATFAATSELLDATTACLPPM